MVYRDPADIEQQHKVEDEIEAATLALEVAVLAVIARRLGKLQDASMVEVYAAMPSDMAEIREIIDKGVKNVEQVAETVMNNMAAANDEWAARYYKARGVAQESAFTHSQMKRTLENNTEGIKRKVTALCRSSVIRIGDGNTFTSIEEGYRRIVSAAATAMTTGNLTIEQATAKAVSKLAKDGLRVQYASDVTRNLYTAVRTNVMDAYRVTMSDMREIQGREFGADGVEVSAHALCAPDHQEYQGKQYSNKEWQKVQFEPARPLVIGANCGHVVYPVILGVSSHAYSSKELRELREQSNKKVTFEGLSGEPLTMTRYEASQYQRKMENSIRKMKENTYLLENANLSNFAKMERKTQRALSKKYETISEAMGLRPRLDLTRIYIQK